MRPITTVLLIPFLISCENASIPEGGEAYWRFSLRIPNKCKPQTCDDNLKKCQSVAGNSSHKCDASHKKCMNKANSEKCKHTRKCYDKLWKENSKVARGGSGGGGLMRGMDKSYIMTDVVKKSDCQKKWYDAAASLFS